MELIRVHHDEIWKVILKMLSKISDNVYFDLFLVACIVSFIFFCIRIFIEKKWSLRTITFGPLSILCALSVCKMIERLPILHPRINLALKTSSNLVMSTKTYFDAFLEKVDFVPENSLDFVSYIYKMSMESREEWTCNPQMLYDSVFRVFKQTRTMFGFFDIHEKSFGSFSFFFTLSIFVIITFLIAINKTNNGYSLLSNVIFLILQSSFLIYTTTQNNGTTFFTIILWIAEDALYQNYKNGNKNIYKNIKKMIEKYFKK